MKRIYLVGGGDYRTGDMDNLNEAIAETVDNNKFLIIPFATAPEKRDKWISAIKSAFSKIRDFDFYIANEEDGTTKVKGAINDCGIIFCTGGRPEKFIDTITNLDIVNDLKEHQGSIVAYSAAALAFSEHCFISKDEDYERSMLIKGLGIIEFSTSVHYEEHEDDEISQFSKMLDIYAIPERSAIVISDKMSLRGDVFLFQKGLKSRA